MSYPWLLLEPLVEVLKMIFTPDSTNLDELVKELQIGARVCIIEELSRHQGQTLIGEIYNIAPNGLRDIHLSEVHKSFIYRADDYQVELSSKDQQQDQFTMRFVKWIETTRGGNREFMHGEVMKVERCSTDITNLILPREPLRNGDFFCPNKDTYRMKYMGQSSAGWLMEVWIKVETLPWRSQEVYVQIQPRNVEDPDAYSVIVTSELSHLNSTVKMGEKLDLYRCEGGLPPQDSLIPGLSLW